MFNITNNHGMHLKTIVRFPLILIIMAVIKKQKKKSAGTDVEKKDSCTCCDLYIKHLLWKSVRYY